MLPQVVFLEEAREVERRSDRRRSLNLQVHASASSARVELHDLSRTGARLKTAAELRIGEILALTLPEGSADLRIVWQKGDLFGAEFLTPVPLAWVSASVLKSPFEGIAEEEASGQQAVRAARRSSAPGRWERPALFALLGLVGFVVALFLYAVATLPIS